jgi:ATP/maltotriose-dependent transcriptional regulator MalT/DNA-binding SARP family transcriptional activator
MGSPERFPAKVVTPVYSKVLMRDRLFNTLDESRQRPAIWLSSPAGAGKTTLISSYTANRDVLVLWYQIDEGDSDPATFFYYLRLAVKRLNPKAAGALPLFTPEYTKGTAIFSRRFFESLFTTFSEPALIVFDNYQDVPTDALVQGILKEAVEVLPSHINMIFISRQAAPRQFSRALANNSITNMERQFLRFNLDETIALANMTDKHLLVRDQAEKIHYITDGWAAGITLYLKNGSQDNAWITKSKTTMTPTEIFDYFSEEIFNCVDEEVQNLLINTAFLPQMTGDMVTFVTGWDKAEEILSELVRANYFINQRHGDKLIFQYHPLFREFLLKKAAQQVPAEALQTLKMNSARGLEQEGWWEAALHIYFDVEDVEQTIRLLLAQAEGMIAQGRHKTLHSWLKKLPAVTCRNNAQLLYWTGISILPTDPNKALTYLENAYQKFNKNDDLSGKLNVQCAILESITYRFDQLGLLDQWIVQDNNFLSKYYEHTEQNEQMRTVFAILNALAFSHPNEIDYDLWEERGLQLLSSDVDVTLKIQISLPMLAYQIYRGNFIKAMDILSNHPDIDENLTIPPLIMVSLHALHTSLYWHVGKFSQCRQSAEAGLALSAKTGVHLVSFMTYVNGAQGAMSEGNGSLADEYFNKMERLLHQTGKYEKAYWYLNCVWKNLMQGHIADAVRNSEMAIGQAKKSGARKIEPIAYLGRALALHHSGKTSQAEQAISNAIDLCEALNTIHTQFACYLAQAEFRLGSPSQQVLTDALEKGLRLGRINNYVNTFYWRKETMAELCATALALGIETAYVRELIKTRQLTATVLPSGIDNWPWPVKVNTMGRFELFLNDARFEFKARVRQKPFDLLKVLIAMDDGNGVAEHEVQDVLWPQAEGDTAVNSYTTTLHRLRRLLDCKDAIRVSAGRVFLDERFIRVDVYVLKRLFIQLDASWETLNDDEFPDEPISVLKDIIDLAEGEFLPGEPSYPIEGMRSALNDRLISNIILLTHRLEALSAWEVAVKWLKTAIRIDDCSEHCYQHLLICYGNLGLKSEAHMSYEQCVRRLSAKLGIAPSEATKAQYLRVK